MELLPGETTGALTAVEEETTSFPTSSVNVVVATVVALRTAAATLQSLLRGDGS